MPTDKNKIIKQAKLADSALKTYRFCHQSKQNISSFY